MDAYKVTVNGTTLRYRINADFFSVYAPGSKPRRVSLKTTEGLARFEDEFVPALLKSPQRLKRSYIHHTRDRRGLNMFGVGPTKLVGRRDFSLDKAVRLNGETRFGVTAVSLCLRKANVNN